MFNFLQAVSLILGKTAMFMRPLARLDYIHIARRQLRVVIACQEPQITFILPGDNREHLYCQGTTQGCDCLPGATNKQHLFSSVTLSICHSSKNQTPFFHLSLSICHSSKNHYVFFQSVTLSLFGLVHYLTFKKSLVFFWSVSLSLFGSVHFLIFKKSDSFFPSVTVNLPLFKKSPCVFWSVTLSLFGLVHYLTFKKSLVFFGLSVCHFLDQSIS